MPNMDNNNSQQPQQNGNNNKFPKGQFIVMLIAALVTLGVAGMMKSYMGSRSQKEVTYDQFIEEVEDGQVESILRRSSRIEIRYKESSENSIRLSSIIPFLFPEIICWQSGFWSMRWKLSRNSRKPAIYSGQLSV